MSQAVAGSMLPPVRLMHMDPFDDFQDQTLVLARGLAAAGVDVQIYCRADAPLFTWATQSGMPVRPLPVSPKPLSPRHLWSLWRAIRAERRKGHTSIILHACDETALLLATHARRLLNNIKLYATRTTVAIPDPKILQAFHKADTCICTSKSGMDTLLQNGMGAARLTAISAGLDSTAYTQRVPRKDGRFIFCALGMLRYANGFETLIDALDLLRRERGLPLWEVRIPGTGPYFADLLNRAMLINVDRYLSFFGGMDERYIIPQCDALIVPEIQSLGNGHAILKGWASRLPVLAAGDRANREYITHGKNGLCFTKGNADALADCMAQFMRDDALAAGLTVMGASSLKEYSLDQMVQRHLACYARHGSVIPS